MFIGISLFIGFMLFCLYIDYRLYLSDREKLNNGVCSNCETKLELIREKEKSRIYMCDKCGYTVICSTNADKKYRKELEDGR